MGQSPQTLSVDDRRIVASWAADCAEHVLAILEDAVPGDPRVRAAAHAAEHAAAVAHMGAHALGAAGCAATASALAAGCGDDALTRSEALRHVAAMTNAVARALASLPALGEEPSGPLGPGRLSGGGVGDAIRAIQELLDDHGVPEAPEGE